MNEILPGVWTWSDVTRAEPCHGFYVVKGREAVVIDPPPPDKEFQRVVYQQAKPVLCLVSNKYHTRASAQVQAMCGCPVYAPQADRFLMSIRVQGVFHNGQRLPCGLLAINVTAGRTPGESCFLFAGERRSLIVGSAVVSDSVGRLSMLGADAYRDPKAAKDGLRVLLDHDFDALLLAAGESILSNGKDELATFLAPEKKPWEDEEVDESEPVSRGGGWMEVEDSDVHMPPD